MKVLFRLLLSISATALMPFIYLVNQGITLEKFYAEHSVWLYDNCIIFASCLTWLCSFKIFSYIIYLIIVLLFSLLMLFLTNFLEYDSISHENIESIELSENNFLPVYLGYFFVGLSLSQNENPIYIYSILVLFSFISNSVYFNPIFMIFKYKFYTVKRKNGIIIFLISKEIYRTKNELCIKKVRRINDYTFIER